MRIEGKYKAKRWFKPWMFVAAVTPYFFLRRLWGVGYDTRCDVMDALMEWKFHRPAGRD